MLSWLSVLVSGWAVLLVVLVVAVTIVASMMFRAVVRTNMVHIVQSRKKTTSYGTGRDAGNVYYKWPSWIPFFGVSVIELPVSNFDLSLKDYEAYDKDRVPFRVDVTAFFRIKLTDVAAQRVASVAALVEQLTQIVQGAVRKILASDVIDQIMLERAKFGTAFTEEVRDQLAEWGVEPVKSMELMDIRDVVESKVIANIMAKKTSHIEMQSRTEVAANMRAAETAEIENRQAVDIRDQEAKEAVGKRTADKEREVGISLQRARQEVLTEERETRTRDMEVKRVEQVKQAEITRDQQVVAAEQDKKTRVIIAEGQLEAQQKEAEAVRVVGFAKADAEKAMQLAPVMAQIKLAKEIGANEGYQGYLARLKALEAYMEVGGKQAEALQRADVKIIANTGKAVEGASSVMDLFSSKGGTDIASMAEALAQSAVGRSVLSKLNLLPPDSAPNGVDKSTPARTVETPTE